MLKVVVQRILKGEILVKTYEYLFVNRIHLILYFSDFMITGSNDTCIKRWNINLKTLSESTTKNLVSHRTQQAHSKNINFISLSKKSNLIATCSFDKTAKVS